MDAIRSENSAAPRLPGWGWGATIAAYGAAALALAVATHVVIPRVIAATTFEPVVVWFLAGGAGVFLPITVAAFVILAREDRLPGRVEPAHGVLRGRLRFRRLDGSDVAVTLAALLAMLAASAASFAVARLALGEVTLGPSFLHFRPLDSGRQWILAAWAPFFALNILSEELLWHAVLLPRQETSFGSRAWLVAGAAWLLFHVPFGRDILLILWPTTFLVPWVVQRTQNSWTGVILHAGINGPGFLAAAFGLV